MTIEQAEAAVGMKVQHITGGPIMTIVGVDPALYKSVLCSWWQQDAASGQFKEQTFRATELIGPLP